MYILCQFYRRNYTITLILVFVAAPFMAFSLATGFIKLLYDKNISEIIFNGLLQSLLDNLFARRTSKSALIAKLKQKLTLELVDIPIFSSQVMTFIDDREKINVIID